MIRLHQTVIAFNVEVWNTVTQVR